MCMYVYAITSAVTISLQKQVDTLKTVNDNVQHLVDFIVLSEEKAESRFY